MIEVHIKTNERNKTFLQEHMSIILTSFVALSAVLVSLFQFLHTKDQAEIQKLMSERTYYNDSLKSLREFNERVYEYKDAKRLALTKFISDNQTKLTSNSENERIFFINLITATYGEESIDLVPLLNSLSSQNPGDTLKGTSQKAVKLLQSNVTQIRNNKLQQFYKPLISSFADGKSLYEEYKSSNFSYYYAELIDANNRKLMRLLLSNDKLIPDYLRQDAQALIDHLTAWSSAFDQKNREEKPNNKDASFRIIHNGITFPDVSAQRFTEEYYRLGGS